MKKIMLLFLLAYCASCDAQTSLWQEENASNLEVKAIRQVWLDLFDALNAGDLAKAFDFYSKESGLIMIDGSSELFLSDKTRETYIEAVKALEQKPKYYHSALQVRFLSADMAIAVYETWMELNGTEISRARASDLFHKKEGKWSIEFEQMTPIQAATGSK